MSSVSTTPEANDPERIVLPEITEPSILPDAKFNFSALIVLLAIFALTTAESAILIVSTASLASLACVTPLSTN